MGRRATAAAADDKQPEQPTVKCDACGRWAYLEETPFADLGEAETENAPFTCRGCQRVEALEAQIAEYVTELARRTKCECCGKGGERIADIETRVQDLEAHAQRDRPEEQSRGRSAAPLVTAQHPVKERVDKATDTEDGGPSKADMEASQTVDERIAQADDNQGSPVGGQQMLAEAPKSGDNKVELANGFGTTTSQKNGDSGEGAPMGSQRTLATTPRGGSNLGGLTIGDGDSAARELNGGEPTEEAQKTERDEGNNKVQSLEKELKSQGAGSTQQKQRKRSWVRPPPGITKEVVVVGDGNVGLFAQSLVDAVGAPEAVEVLYNRGAGVSESLKLIQEYEQAARPLHRMWIIHVGLTDLLASKGEELVSQFEGLCEGKGRSAIVCSIPEVTQRGGEARARIVMANALLKKLCKRRRLRFVDLGINGFEDHLAGDGVSYGREAISKVIRMLQEPITRFLGADGAALSREACGMTGNGVGDPENQPRVPRAPSPKSGKAAKPDRCAAGPTGGTQQSRPRAFGWRGKQVSLERKEQGQRPGPYAKSWEARTADQELEAVSRSSVVRGLEAWIQEAISEQLSRSWPMLSSLRG